MARVRSAVEEIVFNCEHDAELLECVVRLAELVAENRREERLASELASARERSPIQIV